MSTYFVGSVVLLDLMKAFRGETRLKSGVTNPNTGLCASRTDHPSA